MLILSLNFQKLSVLSSKIKDDMKHQVKQDRKADAGIELLWICYIVYTGIIL